MWLAGAGVQAQTSGGALEGLNEAPCPPVGQGLPLPQTSEAVLATSCWADLINTAEVGSPCPHRGSEGLDPMSPSVNSRLPGVLGPVVSQSSCCLSPACPFRAPPTPPTSTTHGDLKGPTHPTPTPLLWPHFLCSLPSLQTSPPAYSLSARPISLSLTHWLQEMAWGSQGHDPGPTRFHCL